MISKHEAWQIAKLFAEDVEQCIGTNLMAVFVIGSLSIGSYSAGRSDIDTLILVKERLRDNTRNAVKGIAYRYRDRFQVPKDFGAVIAVESELYPPYNPEQEMVPEIIRLKSGVLMHGAYDVSQIPEPTKDDFLAYARLFYPWLRKNYIDSRPEEARTLDATVNTLLYEMRLLIWHETLEYVLDKRNIVPLFCHLAQDQSLHTEMDLIQHYLTGDGEQGLDLFIVEQLLTDVSEIIRSRVPLD